MNKNGFVALAISLGMITSPVLANQPGNNVNQGPQGIQGPEGPQGPQGPQGNPGGNGGQGGNGGHGGEGGGGGQGGHGGQGGVGNGGQGGNGGVGNGGQGGNGGVGNGGQGGNGQGGNGGVGNGGQGGNASNQNSSRNRNNNSNTSTATGGSSTVRVSAPTIVQQNGGWGSNFNDFNWNNDNGFGGGIYCRTPSAFVGGHVDGGNADWDGYDTGFGSNSTNYSVRAGVLFPFGSSTIGNCAKLGAEVLKQKQITTDLSLVKACDELKRSGITVDPVKFPSLAVCVDTPVSNVPVTVKSAPKTETSARLNNTPRSVRGLW